MIKVEEELAIIGALIAMAKEDSLLHSALTGLRARLSFAVEDAGAREYEVLKNIVAIASESPIPPMFCELILLGGEGKEWAQAYNGWRTKLADSLKNAPL